MYWRPVPTFPPMPILKGVRSFASMPPSFERIGPKRRLTTRTPAFSAGSHAFSHSRLVCQPRDRFTEQVRSVHATVANLSFLIVCPATGRNAFARQVNDHFKALEQARADVVLIWMPFDLIGAGL